MCRCYTTTQENAACKSSYQGKSNQYRNDAPAINKSTHKKLLLQSVCLLLRRLPLPCTLALQSIRYWIIVLKTPDAGRNSNKKRYQDRIRWQTLTRGSDKLLTLLHTS